MIYEHVIVSSQFVEKRNFDFGLRDEKGRSIGGLLIIEKVETVPFDEKMHHCWIENEIPHGTLYRWNYQSTRDGMPFGAIQPNHYCAFFAAAQQQGAECVKRSKARYAKKGDIK